MNSTLLKKYFEESDSDNFISDVYQANGVLEKHLLEIGVLAYPRRERKDPGFSYQKKQQLRSNESSTREEIIDDYNLHGLESFFHSLKQSQGVLKQDKAHVLWKLLTEIVDYEGSRFFYGAYHWFYRKEKSATFKASFYKLLLQESWIPRKNGVFCQPSHVVESDLPPEFHGARQLQDLLEFGTEAKRQSEHYKQQQSAAQQLGILLDDVELIKEHLELFREWKEYLRLGARGDEAEFPERDSINPERRNKKIAEKAKESPEKTSEVKERSVRQSTINPEPWLRDQYTNVEGQLICQICHQEMPFKKRNGEYYFERVEISSNLTFEDEKLYLATCPVCAAKYKEYVKRRNDVQDKVIADILTTDGKVVLIPLDSKEDSIRFTNIHIGDLRTLLQAWKPMSEKEEIVRVHPVPFENKLEEPNPKELIQCPNCQSKVRRDRLEKHIYNVHGPGKKTITKSMANGSRKNVVTRRHKKRGKKKGKARNINSSLLSISNRCPGCGAVGTCYCG